MGFIGWRQRQRTNQLLEDQISVQRTGKTTAELRGERLRQMAANVRPYERRPWTREQWLRVILALGGIALFLVLAVILTHYLH